MLDSLGWMATAISISSYFCRNTLMLRRVQALASLVWISYGVYIHAVPLIAANVLVGAAAIWSTVRDGRPVAPSASAPGRIERST